MKINTSPISGTQELLPAEQAIFNNLKETIAKSYHDHGYLDIETPSIERTEVLLAKAGGETEKQIYKVTKTSEPTNNPTEALRFDHTVPLARYVIEHENGLTFPFKVSQIGLNFRGERAQKGRFREFYQCDIDIIGREHLSLAYDADVISTLLDTIQSFQLDTPILARISNRKILTGLLEHLNLSDQITEICSIIDHADKVTPEQTKVSLEELGLDKSTVEQVINLINLNGPRSEVITTLNNLDINNETFTEGIADLDQILYLLESMQLQHQITADLKIIRGLDYYTGTVFEFILPDYPNIGSVAGGGRYDNLTQYFSNKSFPGVGGSIGLTRLFYVLNEHSLLEHTDHLLDYAIVPVSEHEYDESFNVANKLRAKGHSATVVLIDKKLNDKMSYASKVANYGIVIGEAEIASNVLQVKNFTTGDTIELNLKVDSNPEDFWAN